MHLHLLGPWRRRFQWLTSLTILLLPWAQLNGKSLLRLDLGTRSLHLFGQLLRIEELYLLLFFSLCLILFFLLVTLVLGRVWCGWFCPQTTLTDLAEWFVRKTGLKLSGNRLTGPLWKKGLVQALYLMLSLLVGANLIWYFIEPQHFFSTLVQGTLHPAVLTCWLGMATCIYLDLALVRRLMCRDFCPYGRFQTALVDPGTLTLLLPKEEEPRCIECGACVRSCPMGIDIRRGYQVECINCGRCLDACRQVMAKRGQKGLIHYRFGVSGLGPKAMLHPRTLLLATALLILSLVLAVAIWQRPVASLKVSVSHTATSRMLPSGQQVTFYTAWVNNRSDRPLTFEIAVSSTPPLANLEIKGQTRDLVLRGGQNRRIEFALLTPALKQTLQIEFHLRDRQGTTYADTAASALPIAPGNTP